jgi:hypothetical protein
VSCTAAGRTAPPRLLAGHHNADLSPAVAAEAPRACTLRATAEAAQDNASDLPATPGCGPAMLSSFRPCDLGCSRAQTPRRSKIREARPWDFARTVAQAGQPGGRLISGVWLSVAPHVRVRPLARHAFADNVGLGHDQRQRGRDQARSASVCALRAATCGAPFCDMRTSCLQGSCLNRFVRRSRVRAVPLPPRPIRARLRPGRAD